MCGMYFQTELEKFPLFVVWQLQWAGICSLHTTVVSLMSTFRAGAPLLRVVIGFSVQHPIIGQ